MMLVVPITCCEQSSISRKIALLPRCLHGKTCQVSAIDLVNFAQNYQIVASRFGEPARWSMIEGFDL
jgi:hypothetical protein